MTLLGSVDIPFTKSTKIAVDATDTAGQAATVAQQATDTAGQAQATAQTASQTATQAAATAADAAQAAQAAIATANGKNKAYYGATTPTSPKSGDIWFVEDSSGNVTAIKHYDGTQWITDVDNTALEQQISAAQAAADNAATVGQAAQQTAADAEAKGDAAAKAAEEAKDAATKAQADAASAVTSANNAVNTANKATQDAQDAIDKAQDGFDAAQDALSKADAAETNSQSALNTANTAAKDAQSALTAANNATDTANTAKQVASDAATQASTAKTNAQTAMSNAQDAISQAKAANDNANTREKSIIKSNTAPSNPATDQLWIDTSKTPQIMRRWNGSAWVDLSPTQASQIGAVSTTTYTTDITNINNTLSQKASVTTVNTLSGRVDSAETAITQNANAIASKADKTVVDTLKNTVDNHSTLISQNADAIALKANASTVDTLTGRVSTAEATLATQANEIAARITKTDADAKYATQTALTATANSLTSSISAVQTNLDNLQVGGRNLIKDSNNFTNLNRNAGAQYTYKTSVSVPEWGAADATEIHVTGGTGTIKLYKFIVGPSVKDCDYTLSVWCKNIGNYPVVITANAFGLVILANGESKRVVMSGKGNGISNFQLNIGTTADNINNPIDFVIWRAKGENGNKATDWSPAPEDMATVIQFNTLSQTLDSTVSRIGNAEGNISALQQTANSFATRISNAEGNISTLTQTAQGLQTQVNDKVSISQFTQLAGVVDSKVTSSQVNSLIADDKQIKDTRKTNEKPSYYLENYKRQTVKEFKILSVVGITTDGTYGVLETNVPWIDTSGGQIKQTLYTDVATYVRFGNNSNDSWGPWKKIADTEYVSSQITQTSNSITQKITDTKNNLQSQINQLSGDINLRVQKGDVINQINVSTEGILIDGKKVHITGQTTIDNAVIKDAMIQSMTANKLTAGTIDANVITVKNINASNIVTGTLDASKAIVTNIDASKITTGTLNAARIAAGSIDASKLNVSSLSALSANLGSVTAGNISGVNIYGGSIVQSSSGQNIWLDQNGFHMQSNQLDVWMNGDHGLEILYNNVTQFKVDLNGNLVANDAKLNGNMELNGTFNIPTTLTGDDRAGMHGRFKYTESLSSYVPKVLDGDWFLNSSSLSFRAKTVVQKTKNTYYTTSYYGSGMLKLRAYVNSSNNQYDGNYTNLNNRVDIMPSQITMGQYQPSGDSDWPDEIKISADGSIYASKTIKSGNVYFNGANAIKNDSTVLFLEGNGGIRTNNILINGYHAIKSLDGGEIFLNNGDTGYVDLTVKALHQSSRWELKENFESMDPEIALKNIIDTDVVRYNFKGESEVHVGLVIDDRDNPEYHACSDFITPNRESKKDDTIVGELMLATKALNNYINDHSERLSVVEEQNKNLLLKIADLETRLAKLEA